MPKRNGKKMKASAKRKKDLWAAEARKAEYEADRAAGMDEFQAGEKWYNQGIAEGSAIIDVLAKKYIKTQKRAVEVAKQYASVYKEAKKKAEKEAREEMMRKEEYSRVYGKKEKSAFAQACAQEQESKKKKSKKKKTMWNIILILIRCFNLVVTFFNYKYVVPT